MLEAPMDVLWQIAWYLGAASRMFSGFVAVAVEKRG
uniref:Uncharacterized protein n=1 Tax=mine drainage metagenome TaxID=410659 RepID=E6QIM6_9ZZZZ